MNESRVEELLNRIEDPSLRDELHRELFRHGDVEENLIPRLLPSPQQLREEKEAKLSYFSEEKFRELLDYLKRAVLPKTLDGAVETDWQSFPFRWSPSPAMRKALIQACNQSGYQASQFSHPGLFSGDWGTSGIRIEKSV
ncbi:MAG: hypothetical protein ACYTFG_02215 [Planctomycetota bacterium]|jgi:hypothetical protein